MKISPQLIAPSHSHDNSTSSADIAVGTSVIVRHDQRRLGGSKYPGRSGVVVEENRFGRPDGLWYVRLAPTNRAKERVEAFWTRDLNIVANAQG